MKQYHPYHLVNPSPWPYFSSIVALALTFGLTLWFHSYANGLIIIIVGIIFLLTISYLWWKDIVRESTYQGHHTSVVQKGLSIGIILFIISEILFFFSFFWTFFHSSLAPTAEIGGIWPPIGIVAFNPFEVPLLNTLLLLTSGSTITWSHHSILTGNRKNTLISLILTICLGFIFTLLQIYEYVEAPFTIADSIYGSIFFLTTGFHGIHVIIGTIFLSICLVRLLNYHFTSFHHFGFEAAAWYWHFVDIVWLFVFTFYYWWAF